MALSERCCCCQGATTRSYCRRTALRAGKRCCMQCVDRSSRRPGLRRRRSSEQAWERRQPVLVAAMGHSMWLALICLCQAMDKHLLHAPRSMATSIGLSFDVNLLRSSIPSTHGAAATLPAVHAQLFSRTEAMRHWRFSLSSQGHTAE